MIDSLEGLKVYDTTDAFFQLWHLKFSDEFGLYKFRQTDMDIDDKSALKFNPNKHVNEAVSQLLWVSKIHI